MARGRMVAKTLSTSQKYARLNQVAGKRAEFCQALFPLLIAHADDSGRLSGDVFTVKHAICPTSPRKESDVDAALGALDEVGLIHWYQVNGERYIEIQQFSDHQPGLKNRGNSKIPAMPGNAVGCREMPSEEKRTEGKRTEENRREGNGADAPVPLHEVTENDPVVPDCKIDALVLKWNQTVTAPIPQCLALSAGRKAHAKARLKENLLADLMLAIEKIEASGFCHKNDRNWKPDFGWLMQSQDNVIKVLEGKYDDGPALKATGTEGRGRTGAPPKDKYAEFTGEGE